MDRSSKQQYTRRYVQITPYQRGLNERLDSITPEGATLFTVQGSFGRRTVMAEDEDSAFEKYMILYLGDDYDAHRL